MKKTKYILLLLAVLLCMTGCNNDTEPTITETTTSVETSLSVMEREQLECKFQGEPRCVIRTAEATYKDSEGNILSSAEMDNAVIRVRTKVRFYSGGGFRKKVDEVLPGLVAEKVVWFEGYETPEALAEYTEHYREDSPEWIAWFFSEEGIVFGFEEGLFTARAAGCLEVTIPYDDIKEYMVEKYVP